MTPEEIDAVVGSWQSLAPRRARLQEIVAAHLPDAEGWPPSERAGWILEAVARCVSRLSQPSDLVGIARAVATTYRAWGVTALREDGEALLMGLQLSGSLDIEARVAWRRAWYLVGELVASAALSPFGNAPDRPGDGPPMAPAT
jgi:hypothetical protein